MLRVALLVIALSACRGVNVGFVPAPGAAPHPARAAADVTVYSVKSDDGILPVGVWLDPKDFDAPLRVDPPHELLGTVEFDMCYLRDALGEARAEAARRGANALFDPGDCKGRAWAVALSDAASAPEAAALLAEQGTSVADYAVIAEEARSLAAFQPVAIDATRGRCYAVGYALAADASFTNAARRRLVTTIAGVVIDGDDLPDVGGFTWGDASMSISLDAEGNTRAGFARAVCVSADRRLSISLGRADDSAAVLLGRGDVVVRVYARDIEEAELARRIADRKESNRAAAAEKAELQAQGCLICRQHRDVCLHDNMCDEYIACLRAYEARPGNCTE
jgi:hypothetical protein